MIDGAVAHAETEKRNILGMKVPVRDVTPEEVAALLQQLNGTDIYKQVMSGNEEAAINIITKAIEKAFSKGVSVTSE